MDAVTKNAATRLLILQKMAEGLSAPVALDAVCGAGTYKRLAGELYDALRAKAGAK